MNFILFLLFIASASGIQIECEFNFNPDWDPLGPIYSCSVTSINFSDNSTEIQVVNGTHLDGYSSDDVNMVFFLESNCKTFNLTFFPRGFQNFFPNIIGFYVRGCSIETLNGDELTDFPNLRLWSQMSSNLNRVPGNFFNPTPNIESISFSYNQITRVGENLLDNLTNLYDVNFLSNICISKIASEPSIIPALIELLRAACPDSDQIPTTTALTPPSQPERCFESFIEVYICELSEKVQNLDENFKYLDERLKVLEWLSPRIENFKNENEKLEKKIKKIESKNEILEENFKNLIKILKDQKILNKI